MPLRLDSQSADFAERFRAFLSVKRDAAQDVEQTVRGIIAGTDEIVTEPAEKAALHRDTGAAAVDMESHIAARLADAYHLPFAALRVVSDAAEDRLPPAVIGAIDADGKLRLAAVLGSIARNPLQIPALIRTGRGSEAATKSLLRGFDLLGIGFGCPHLG